MPNSATGPARDAGQNNELARILRDCAERVPGSLERLQTRYDEHLRSRVGCTLAGAAVAGPALRAVLAASCAEAAEFDPARESAEVWLAARVRYVRGAASLVPFPARTDRRVVPASPAPAPQHTEGDRSRVVGGHGDGATEPQELAAPGRDGDDSEPGPSIPIRGGEVGNGGPVSRDGGADREPGVAREDAGARHDGPTEPAADPPLGAATGEADYRWVANYQRTEIRSLEMRLQDLERRLRLRTVALFGILALSGFGAIGGAYLVLRPLVESGPAAAMRTAAGTGGQPSGAADSAPGERAPEAGAGPGPASEPPAPPAAVREAGPPPRPEASPPSRAEPSRTDEARAVPAPEASTGSAAPDEIVAKGPESGPAPGLEPGPLGVTQPAGTAAGPPPGAPSEPARARGPAGAAGSEPPRAPPPSAAAGPGSSATLAEPGPEKPSALPESGTPPRGPVRGADQQTARARAGDAGVGALRAALAATKKSLEAPSPADGEGGNAPPAPASGPR